ncbi:MAG: hypothetical protein OXL38_15060 [Gammaproteobacteria bacterium]|nr:hypothetical protein [Gammaproteobacteria bacterium]
MASHQVADISLADFRRREIAVGRRLPTFAICAALALAVPAMADPNAEFAAAFTAYRETMEASRYIEAVAHAEKARELGEEIYADDAKVIATLAYNHGYALAMMGASRPAYRVLKEARKLMGRAYGPDSVQVFRVEMSMLNTVSPDSVAQGEAKGQLTRVLKMARRHHAEDSEVMAELKLNGGMRVWWDRRAPDLLNEAAETFERLGKTDREARARFWIGKIHLERDRFRDSVESMTPVVELLPDDDSVALMARAHMVEAYEELGESDRATEHCLAIGKTVPWTGTADYQPLFKEAPVVPRGAVIMDATKVFVLLEFTVDEMGFVRDPVVVKSNPGTPALGATLAELVRRFRAAAIDAAKKFRYAPRFVDGQPVAVEGVRNRIVFRKRD